ncbi:ATP-binding cassette domain-containing protein [Metallosphaera tengchongensis]|uniref:ATP-binding cassette domain-containing protein n=1 Tax=Metallosphaera tengchongensis TaxID=1532350 RepID=A0A6N0NUU9_9CREN|nr:ATP-binding cassette domain-containing protein [Metallosphaera tengchongensis]QKQ99954.1 ATP-binding cassette domain-containing protein [Metallosphaera tengchongensis]
MLTISHPYIPGKLELEKEEIVAIVGKNGSGKTTLINSILCEMKNEINVDGKDFCNERRYDELSAVFQDPSSQILAETLNDELRIISLYHQVNFELARILMGDFLFQNFFTLSDGYKKRFVISSILSSQPKYVLLDEPLSNLDRNGSKLVLEILPKGSLIAEHRTREISGLVDRVYLLKETGMREIEKEKLKDEEFLRKNGLRGFTLDNVDNGLLGEKILDFDYKDLRIEVRESEIVCLLGPNGSGKTTLLKKLSKKIYSVFQNPDLQFFQESVEKEVGNTEALRLFGLWDIRDKSPFVLSTGQKMRTLIAAAYASGSKVIGLDEPTVAMDGDGLIAFRKMLKLLKEEGRGVIIATHDEDIVNLCDTKIRLG